LVSLSIQQICGKAAAGVNGAAGSDTAALDQLDKFLLCINIPRGAEESLHDFVEPFHDHLPNAS